MSEKFGHSSTSSQPTNSLKHDVEELAGLKRSLLQIWFERAALFVERPFNWMGGAFLNIFYHTDTLAVFLWLVVAFTGLYLTLFYQFGFDAAYKSVAKMETQVLAHLVRAIHRYASGSAMIVTLLHGFRLFFMNRFRGARWLAWVSGVVMVLFLWVEGLTGYWLVWDQRSQLITNSFANFLARVSPAAPAFVSGLFVAGRTDQSWIFITILLGIHILLYGGVALFFWWHIMRLRNPRFLPARYWLIGAGAVLIIISAAFPIGMLPKNNFGQLPNSIALDPFYLLMIPFSMGPAAGWLWGILGLVFILLGLAPWISFRKPLVPIQIHSEKCTGCTLCSKDCPYNAITMQPRMPGEAHKFLAQVDPKLCTACGVCLGSCETEAISLSELSETAIWKNVETRLGRHPDQSVTLCFTCERHAVQGARPYLIQQRLYNQAIEVIPLPCVAVIPPRLVGRSIDAGAGEIRIIGCSPSDCSRREGNLITEERMNRTRLPRLKKAYENAPILTFWLSPDAFSQAMPVLPSQPMKVEQKAEKTSPGHSFSPVLTWRNFVLTFCVLAILMAVQVLVTQTWSPKTYPTSLSVIKLIIPDPNILVYPADRFMQKYAKQPEHLILRDGDTVLLEKDYLYSKAGMSKPIVLEFPATAGDHSLTLSLVSDSTQLDETLNLYTRTVSLSPGQVWLIMYDSLPRPK